MTQNYLAAPIDAGPPTLTPPSSIVPAGPDPIGPPDPVGRRFRLGKLYPRTLATRLTLGVIALVVIIVAAVGSTTYLSLRSFLTDRLDQQLNGAVGPTVNQITLCVNNGICPDRQGGYHGFGKVWVAYYDTTESQYYTFPAAVLGGSSGIGAIEPGTATSQLVANPGDIVNLQLKDGTELRATSAQRGTGIFIIGVDTDEVSSTLHRLVWLELIIGLGTLVVATLVTAYGVRLSLRPLRNVTRTAQTVAAELSPSGAGLDRRVPVGDPDSDVGQLATSMNTLLGSVEDQFGARLESEHRMRQFLADASHELRTPLVSIRGYAELARMQRQRGAEQSAAASADALDRIEGEGTRMSRLVDDLLVLARSDRGAVLHHDQIDVPTLIDDVVSAVRAAHPTRDITIQAQPGLSLLGDHDQLLRVLRNLVTNAAIHTGDGPIAVRGFGDGQQVVLQVQDSGPGLAPEDAAQVFGRFWRADKARTRVRGGSGLGLSIVASIVQAHGGNVTFVSSIDEGSTVTVVLPMAAPRELAAPIDEPRQLYGESDAGQ